MDVVTLWNSTYKMIKSLIQFQQCLLTENLACSSAWQYLEKLLNDLEPIYIATMKLQTDQLFLGFLYSLDGNEINSAIISKHAIKGML